MTVLDFRKVKLKVQPPVTMYPIWQCKCEGKRPAARRVVWGQCHTCLDLTQGLSGVLLNFTCNPLDGKQAACMCTTVCMRAVKHGAAKVCIVACGKQEREAAKQLPGASSAPSNTFEPGEGMAEAAAPSNGDQPMTGKPAASCCMQLHWLPPAQARTFAALVGLGPNSRCSASSCIAQLQLQLHVCSQHLQVHQGWA